MALGLNFPAATSVPSGTVAIRPVMVERTHAGLPDFPVPNPTPTPTPCPIFLGAQSAAILRAENAKPHRFSGLPKDFRSFERDLEVYFERWTSVQAGALTDRTKMDILEEVLDQATSKMLHEWRSTDPTMDFVTVWKKVRKMFGDAVVGGARQEWRSLRFEYSGKLSTSVVSWRNFCADFQRLRKEVHDASEGEAVEFIRERIPHILLRAINKEESTRRKRDGCVVRISGLLQIPENIVLNFLNEEGIPGIEYIRIRQGCHEAVMGELTEAEFLVSKVNGMVVNRGGTAVTISAARLGGGMSSTEIMDFVTDFLAADARVDEEAKRGFQSRQVDFSRRDRSRHSNRPNFEERRDSFDIDNVSVTSDPAHDPTTPTSPISPRTGKSAKGAGNRRPRSKSPGKIRSTTPRKSDSPKEANLTTQNRDRALTPSRSTYDNQAWIENNVCYH